MNEAHYSNDTIMEVLENNNFIVICENIFFNITDTIFYIVVSQIPKKYHYMRWYFFYFVN